MWKNFDDERLARVLALFQASRSETESKQDLEFMLPCLNISELNQLFSTIKSKVPAADFQNIFSNSQKLLEQEII